MKLAAWLSARGIKRIQFAKIIDVSPSHVTQLCGGTIWPGRSLARRIAEATDGDVTADDFVDDDAPVKRRKAAAA